jgi:hypothetical protein
MFFWISKKINLLISKKIIFEKDNVCLPVMHEPKLLEIWHVVPQEANHNPLQQPKNIFWTVLKHI